MLFFESLFLIVYDDDVMLVMLLFVLVMLLSFDWMIFCIVFVWGGILFFVGNGLLMLIKEWGLILL